MHEVGRHGIRVVRVGARFSTIAETKLCTKISVYSNQWSLWAYCDSRSTVPDYRCAELDLLAESLPRHSQQEADHSWAPYREGTFQGRSVAAKGFPRSYFVYSVVEEGRNYHSGAEAAPYVDQVGLG